MRVANAYVDDLLVGYAMDAAQILSDNTASTSTGLVTLVDVPATTMCPHHLLPASGRVHLGYWPGARVVGFGSLARIVTCFTRRLALQEDIGRTIAEALVMHLGARAAGVVVDFSPSCLVDRGDAPHGARAMTTAFAGEAVSDAALRGEFLMTIGLRAS
jgi:GTP cyclohydrolase I